MAVKDIYSKRHKSKVDVFIYEPLSEKLKIQIILLWTKFFAQVPNEFRKEYWKIIHSIICEEHGKKTLLEDTTGFGGRYYDHYKVENYFEELTNVEESLDIIEIIFRIIENTPKNLKANGTYFRGTYNPQEVIKDINTRFLENDFGYEYQSSNIIRIDNELLHKEIIIETLHFLSTETFSNANDEFLSAHAHFRQNRLKECLSDCLKSLETTMKIICKENGWTYKEKDTANTLISICISNNLIPSYLLSHFTSLRTSIESGVPTLRNKLGGHGQGTKKIDVPNHYASYMLYLTGTTINFLISCQREIKPII